MILYDVVKESLLDQSRFNLTDLAVAREIATQTIEDYGDMSEVEWIKFRKDGIWNDHVAVQAALIGMMVARRLAK